MAFVPFGQADGALCQPHPFRRHTQLQIRRRRDNPRQIEQGAHAIGLDFERAAIAVDRFGELILHDERAREALMRIGIFGRELDRLLIALDRAIHLPALGQRAPEVVVTGSIQRVGTQRSPVQLNRVVQIVLPVPDDGEAVERLGKRGLQTRAPVETTPRRRCSPAGSAAHARRRSGVPRLDPAARPP